MWVEVTRADRRKAQKVYRMFASKPDSEHIASEFALAHLAAVLRTNEIKSVLEFGAGIGTATYLILSSRPDVAVDCTERVPLCLEALERNIPPHLRQRLTVHSGREPVAGTFDLVVMDGRTDCDAILLKPGSVCFAEGRRGKARAMIEETLRVRGQSCHFTEYKHIYRVIRWRPNRFKIPIPHTIWKKRKGCWIGQVVDADATSK